MYYIYTMSMLELENNSHLRTGETWVTVSHPVNLGTRTRFHNRLARAT